MKCKHWSSWPSRHMLRASWRPLETDRRVYRALRGCASSYSDLFEPRPAQPGLRNCAGSWAGSSVTVRISFEPEGRVFVIAIQYITRYLRPITRCVFWSCDLQARAAARTRLGTCVVQVPLSKMAQEPYSPLPSKSNEKTRIVSSLKNWQQKQSLKFYNTCNAVINDAVV